MTEVAIAGQNERLTWEGMRKYDQACEYILIMKEQEYADEIAVVGQCREVFLSVSFLSTLNGRRTWHQLH